MVHYVEFKVSNSIISSTRGYPPGKDTVRSVFARRQNSIGERTCRPLRRRKADGSTGDGYADQETFSGSQTGFRDFCL